jgi:hypothetical protein
MPDEILSVPQAKTVIEQLRAELKRQEQENLASQDELRISGRRPTDSANISMTLTPSPTKRSGRGTDHVGLDGCSEKTALGRGGSS